MLSVTHTNRQTKIDRQRYILHLDIYIYNHRQRTSFRANEICKIPSLADGSWIWSLAKFGGASPKQGVLWRKLNDFRMVTSSWWKQTNGWLLVVRYKSSSACWSHVLSVATRVLPRLLASSSVFRGPMVWANPCTNCSVVPCGPPGTSSGAKIWKSRYCHEVFNVLKILACRHQNVKRIQEAHCPCQACRRYIVCRVVGTVGLALHCWKLWTALPLWQATHTAIGRNALSLWVPGSSSHLLHNKTAGKKFPARGELQLACPSAEFCWPQPQLVQMPGMDVSAQMPNLTNTAQKCAKGQGCLESQK